MTIAEELENYQMFLESPIPDDVESVVTTGTKLCTIMARSAFILADCKKKYNDKIRGEVVEELKVIARETPYATARTVDLLVKSMCAEEQYLLDWAERINRTSTHQIEYCRTLISLAKQEMYVSRAIQTT